VTNLEKFPSGKNTYLSDLKPPDLERPIDRTLQFHHGMSKFLEYPANDSIAALFDLHLNPC
jgi:hypothetical protein